MPDDSGTFKGISLGGKAGEAWERIFGRAPAEVEVSGAFRAAVEAEMRGLSAHIEAEDRRMLRMLSRHYGPLDCLCVAGLPGLTTCARCPNVDPAPEDAGSED